MDAKGHGHGDVSTLTPSHTLTPFTSQDGECEKRGRTLRRRQSETERVAAFVTGETTVFVPHHHGGTRATNVKQTKARGTSVLCGHTHTSIFTRLPTKKTQEQENDSGELPVLEEDGKSKPRNKQWNCVNVYMHPHRHAQ